MLKFLRSPLIAAATTSVAVALPLLWAHAVVPDTVFEHQMLALAIWALALVWAGGSLRFQRPAADIVAGLAICALAASLAGFGLWFVAAASMVALVALCRSPAGDAAAGFGWGWWIAGVGSTAVALIQYLGPQAADAWLLAASTTPGRAVGNLRQPNHLATALLCAMVWTAWLWQAGRLRPRWAMASLAAMVFAVALSASRTGALALGVLLLWAWVDRRLPRAARWSLAATPLLYVVCWLALSAWADWRHAEFYGAERFESQADISSSRFAIWKNTLVLIARNPWTGVGWGNFNFAWTFTPFPDRPVAFFDHTHNLVLQLAVEIGLPATALLLGLLGWALWRARGAWHATGDDAAPPARAALVMLAVLVLHSLLEYPLWYAYFLLPAAWALGLFLGAAPHAQPAGARPARGTRWAGGGVRVAGAVMLVGALYAAWDHRRIEAIFAPPPGAAPLAERIADGRRSRLFGHHADYAAVTTEPRDLRLPSFRRPLHQLIDTRLLIAYIEALRADGRDAAALYAAQRLREFRRPDAQAYFADCTPDQPDPPFQCNTTPVALSWRDLEP